MSQTYHRLTRRQLPALLSIVVPLWNEEDAVPFLRQRLSEFMDSLPCPAEVVLVNDGSEDRTLDLLLEWAEADWRIKVVSLGRQFGHQAASTAGLDHAAGEAVVLMDADLQDPPEVIRDMLAEYCRGFDVVYGRRTSRHGETRFKRATAWLFYRLMHALIYRDLPVDVGDFRLISRRCLEALQQMRETHRFLRGMVAWVGFAQTAVPYVRQARIRGETKYPLLKMIRFAWTAAISFSPAPLRVSFGVGVLLGLMGVSEGVYAVARTMLGLYTVPGWTSLVVVLCLIGSAILISIGILGEYVGRIYEEAKGRPLYIVTSSANLRAREARGEYHPREQSADQLRAAGTLDSVSGQLRALSAASAARETVR
ncbi:MAG: glycosyltransferase family 2 protein [Acidobacteria bacterium]|nr:glycosyltransferase family 2 protein [Acidobacteriota bacterium]